MHALRRPVGEADDDRPEVVLRELARKSLEAHHRAWGGRAHVADQVVEHGLRPVVAGELGAAQQLDTQQVRRLREPTRDPGAVGLGLRRPADPAARALAVRIVGVITGSPTMRRTLLLPTATCAAISSSVCAAFRRT